MHLVALLVLSALATCDRMTAASPLSDLQAASASASAPIFGPTSSIFPLSLSRRLSNASVVANATMSAASTPSSSASASSSPSAASVSASATTSSSRSAQATPTATSSTSATRSSDATASSTVTPSTSASSTATASVTGTSSASGTTSGTASPSATSSATLDTPLSVAFDTPPTVNLSYSVLRLEAARAGGIGMLQYPVRDALAQAGQGGGIVIGDREGHWVRSGVKLELLVEVGQASSAQWPPQAVYSCSDPASPLFGRLNLTCSESLLRASNAAEWAGYDVQAVRTAGHSCELTLWFNNSARNNGTTPETLAAGLNACLVVGLLAEVDTPFRRDFALRLRMTVNETEDPATIDTSGGQPAFANKRFMRGGRGFPGFPLATVQSSPLLLSYSTSNSSLRGLPLYQPELGYGALPAGGGTGATDVYVTPPMLESSARSGSANLLSSVLPQGVSPQAVFGIAQARWVTVQLDAGGCSAADELQVTSIAELASRPPALGATIACGGSLTFGQGSDVRDYPSSLWPWLGQLRLVVGPGNALPQAVSPWHPTAAGYRSIRVSYSATNSSNTRPADVALQLLVPVTPANDPPALPTGQSLPVQVAIDENVPAELLVVVTSNCSDPRLQAPGRGTWGGPPALLCMEDPDPVAVPGRYGAGTLDGGAGTSVMQVAAQTGEASNALAVTQVSRYSVLLQSPPSPAPEGGFHLQAVGGVSLDCAGALGDALEAVGGNATAGELFRLPLSCWAQKYSLSPAVSFDYESMHGQPGGPPAFTFTLLLQDESSLAPSGVQAVNSSAVTVRVSIMDKDDTPSITSIRGVPEGGLSVMGGDWLQIGGQGLGYTSGRASDVTVWLNNSAQELAWQLEECAVVTTGTLVRCRSPPGYGIGLRLALTHGGGVTSNASTFTLDYEQPRVLSLELRDGRGGRLHSIPANGSLPEGARLRINGTGLSDLAPPHGPHAYTVLLNDATRWSLSALAQEVSISTVWVSPEGRDGLVSNASLPHCSVLAVNVMECTGLPAGAGGALSVEIRHMGRTSRPPVLNYTAPSITNATIDYDTLILESSSFPPDVLSLGHDRYLDWVQYAHLPQGPGSINLTARCAGWVSIKVAPCDIFYGQRCTFNVTEDSERGDRVPRLRCGLDPMGWGQNFSVRISVGGQVSEWYTPPVDLSYPPPEVLLVTGSSPYARDSPPDPVPAHTSDRSVSAMYVRGCPAFDLDRPDTAWLHWPVTVVVGGVELKPDWDGLMFVSGVPAPRMLTERYTNTTSSVNLTMPSGSLGSLGWGVIMFRAPRGYGTVDVVLTVGGRSHEGNLSYMEPQNPAFDAYDAESEGDLPTGERRMVLNANGLPSCVVCAYFRWSTSACPLWAQQGSDGWTCAQPREYRGANPTPLVVETSNKGPAPDQPNITILALSNVLRRDGRLIVFFDGDTEETYDVVITLGPVNFSISYSYGTVSREDPAVTAVDTNWANDNNTAATITMANAGAYGSVYVRPAVGIVPRPPQNWAGIRCPTHWYTKVCSDEDLSRTTKCTPSKDFYQVSSMGETSIATNLTEGAVGSSLITIQPGSGGDDNRNVAAGVVANHTRLNGGYVVLFVTGNAKRWQWVRVLPCHVVSWAGTKKGTGHEVKFIPPMLQGGVVISVRSQDSTDAKIDEAFRAATYDAADVDSVSVVIDGVPAANATAKLPTDGGEILIRGKNFGYGADSEENLQLINFDWDMQQVPLPDVPVYNSIRIRYSGYDEYRACVPIAGEWKPDSIRCTAAGGAPATKNAVSIVYGLDTSTEFPRVPGNSNEFTYATPVISHLDPVTGSTEGGYNVTIYGSNLGEFPLWSTLGPDPNPLVAASVEIGAGAGVGVLHLSTQGKKWYDLVPFLSHSHKHITFVMPPFIGTVGVSLKYDTLRQENRDITLAAMPFKALPPVVTKIEAKRGVDHDPCYELWLINPGAVRTRNMTNATSSTPVPTTSASATASASSSASSSASGSAAPVNATSTPVSRLLSRSAGIVDSSPSRSMAAMASPRVPGRSQGEDVAGRRVLQPSAQGPTATTSADPTVSSSASASASSSGSASASCSASARGSASATATNSTSSSIIGQGPTMTPTPRSSALASMQSVGFKFDEDLEPYGLSEARPCFKAVYTAGDPVTLVINGTNFGTASSAVEVKLRPFPASPRFTGEYDCEATWISSTVIECKLQTPDIPQIEYEVSLRLVDTALSAVLVPDIHPVAMCPAGWAVNDQDTSTYENRTCTECDPLRSGCIGVDAVPLARPGFWKINATNTTLARNYNPDTIDGHPDFLECPGGSLTCGSGWLKPNMANVSLNRCVKGNNGWACTKCDDGWSRGSNGACQECVPTRARSTDVTPKEIVLSVVALLSVSVMGLLILYVFQGEKQKSGQPGWMDKWKHAMLVRLDAACACNRCCLGQRRRRKDAPAQPDVLTVDEAKAEEKLKPKPMPLIKVGITFLQTMAALSAYGSTRNLKAETGPDNPLVSFLLSFDFFVELGANAAALQCAISIPTDVTIIMWMVAPVLCGAVVALLAAIMTCVAKTSCYRSRVKNPVDSKEISAKGNYITLFLVFMILPAAISALARARSCALKDKGNYLLQDPDVPCDKAEFKRLMDAALAVAVLYLLVPVIVALILLPVRGIPGYSESKACCRCCYRLKGEAVEDMPTEKQAWKQRRRDVQKARKHRVMETLRFLWDGSRAEKGFSFARAWECIVLLRKVVFMGLGTGLFWLDKPVLQCGATTLLLCISLAWHGSVSPYASPAINVLESLSLLAATIYSMAVLQRLAVQGEEIAELAERVQRLSTSTEDKAKITFEGGRVQIDPERRQMLWVFEGPALAFSAVFLAVWAYFILDLSLSGGQTSLALIRWAGLDPSVKEREERDKIREEAMKTLSSRMLIQKGSSAVGASSRSLMDEDSDEEEQQDGSGRASKRISTKWGRQLPEYLLVPKEVAAQLPYMSDGPARAVGGGAYKPSRLGPGHATTGALFKVQQAHAQAATVGRNPQHIAAAGLMAATAAAFGIAPDSANVPGAFRPGVARGSYGADPTGSGDSEDSLSMGSDDLPSEDESEDEGGGPVGGFGWGGVRAAAATATGFAAGVAGGAWGAARQAAGWQGRQQQRPVTSWAGASSTSASSGYEEGEVTHGMNPHYAATGAANAGRVGGQAKAVQGRGGFGAAGMQSTRAMPQPVAAARASATYAPTAVSSWGSLRPTASTAAATAGGSGPGAAGTGLATRGYAVQPFSAAQARAQASPARAVDRRSVVAGQWGQRSPAQPAAQPMQQRQRQAPAPQQQQYWEEEEGEDAEGAMSSSQSWDGEQEGGAALDPVVEEDPRPTGRQDRAGGGGARTVLAAATGTRGGRGTSYR